MHQDMYSHNLFMESRPDSLHSELCLLSQAPSDYIHSYLLHCARQGRVSISFSTEAHLGRDKTFPCPRVNQTISSRCSGCALQFHNTCKSIGQRDILLVHTLFTNMDHHQGPNSENMYPRFTSFLPLAPTVTENCEAQR